MYSALDPNAFKSALSGPDVATSRGATENGSIACSKPMPKELTSARTKSTSVRRRDLADLEKCRNPLDLHKDEYTAHDKGD